jgi:hypothetical protein
MPSVYGTFGNRRRSRGRRSEDLTAIAYRSVSANPSTVFTIERIHAMPPLLGKAMNRNASTGPKLSLNARTACCQSSCSVSCLAMCLLPRHGFLPPPCHPSKYRSAFRVYGPFCGQLSRLDEEPVRQRELAAMVRFSYVLASWYLVDQLGFIT